MVLDFNVTTFTRLAQLIEITQTLYITMVLVTAHSLIRFREIVIGCTLFTIQSRWHQLLAKVLVAKAANQNTESLQDLVDHQPSNFKRKYKLDIDQLLTYMK